MLRRNILLTSLFVTTVFLGGCRTGLFGGSDVQVPIEPATPPAPLVVDGVRTSYADVVERTSPAVVRIEAESRARRTQDQAQPNPFGEGGDDDLFRQFQTPRQNPQPRIERGLGSGVIVSADGTILTNAHVVDRAEKLTVILSDNKTFDAKLVGADKLSDLAVLKIEAQNLPYLNLGNSDTVRIGDIVLAIGNPLGIGQTVTAGIISAKGRRTGLSYGNNDAFEDFLQTDAPINRGNSGGALVNLSGELIGINSQILASRDGGSIGIGFSIPSNMAKSVMEQLLRDGRVRRGMLGIGIQNLTEDTAQALGLKDTSGVLVSDVRKGSAAEKAGFKRTDVIIAINGEKIEDSNVLRNKVAGTLPGTEIRVTVLRDGSSHELTATLDEFELAGNKDDGDSDSEGGTPEKQSDTGKLGLTLQPVTPQIAKQLGIEGDVEGMVVTGVDADGTAAEAGIARGDVVLEINRRPVNSTDAVQSALQSAAGKPVLLLISRRGQTIYLTVKP